MTSGSPDSLRVYGTLLGDNDGHGPVNIVIRRASESKEHDGDDGLLLVREASGVLVGDGGVERVGVDILEDGRVLAVTAAPDMSGKRLRLDIALKEPEPVRCAYEVGVTPIS